MPEEVYEKSSPQLRGCDRASIECVIVTYSLKGSGKENDPYREAVQYWTLDGKLLFEK